MAPSLVQSQSATGGASSPLTVTLGSPTTAGNCLIVTFVGSSATNPSITGITLGGSAGNFAQVLTAGSVSTDACTVQVWADPGCAGGQTAVAVSFSPATTSVCITVMEWSGLAASSPADQTASQVNDAGTTSWSSTATGTTTQASEVAIGCVGGFNGSGIGTISGPGSPWTNLAQETSASAHVGLLTGYQVLSSTGTVTYSGTFAASSEYTAAVATFKAAASSVTSAGAVSLGSMAVAGSGTAAIAAAGAVSLGSMSTAGAAGPPSLRISIAGQSGTDPEFGTPYESGVWIYGTGNSAMGMHDNGGQPQLRMAPANVTHNTSVTEIFTSSLNAGAANEQTFMSAISGKEGGLDDAGLQLFSEAADGSVPALAVIEFGGQIGMTVTKANTAFNTPVQPGNGSSPGAHVYSGSGAPGIGGTAGDLYIRSDGGAGSYLYRCTGGSAWTAFA